MDDFVMGERKKEILLKSVEHAEGEIPMVMLADRPDRAAIYFQRVMHPAHIPLHPESQSPRIGRARDRGPEVDSSAKVCTSGCRR